MDAEEGAVGSEGVEIAPSSKRPLEVKRGVQGERGVAFERTKGLRSIRRAVKAVAPANRRSESAIESADPMWPTFAR